MKAFLDDIRNLDDEYVKAHYPDITFDVIWRHPREAMIWMEKNGCPKFIGFDHDLGEDFFPYRFTLTGMQVVKWMIEEDQTHPGFIPWDFSFGVHSSNPGGAKNIRSLLSQYLEERGQ